MAEIVKCSTLGWFSDLERMEADEFNKKDLQKWNECCECEKTLYKMGGQCWKT